MSTSKKCIRCGTKLNEHQHKLCYQCVKRWYAIYTKLDRQYRTAVDKAYARFLKGRK